MLVARACARVSLGVVFLGSFRELASRLRPLVVSAIILCAMQMRPVLLVALLRVPWQEPYCTDPSVMILHATKLLTRHTSFEHALEFP